MKFKNRKINKKLISVAAMTLLGIGSTTYTHFDTFRRVHATTQQNQNFQGRNAQTGKIPFVILELTATGQLIEKHFQGVDYNVEAYYPPQLDPRGLYDNYYDNYVTIQEPTKIENKWVAIVRRTNVDQGTRNKIENALPTPAIQHQIQTTIQSIHPYVPNSQQITNDPIVYVTNNHHKDEVPGSQQYNAVKTSPSNVDTSNIKVGDIIHGWDSAKGQIVDYKVTSSPVHDDIDHKWYVNTEAVQPVQTYPIVVVDNFDPNYVVNRPSFGSRLSADDTASWQSVVGSNHLQLPSGWTPIGVSWNYGKSYWELRAFNPNFSKCPVQYVDYKTGQKVPGLPRISEKFIQNTTPSSITGSDIVTDGHNVNSEWVVKGQPEFNINTRTWNIKVVHQAPVIFTEKDSSNANTHVQIQGTSEIMKWTDFYDNNFHAPTNHDFPSNFKSLLDQLKAKGYDTTSVVPVWNQDTKSWEIPLKLLKYPVVYVHMGTHNLIEHSNQLAQTFTKNSTPTDFTIAKVAPVMSTVNGNSDYQVSGVPVWNEQAKRWEVPAIEIKYSVVYVVQNTHNVVNEVTQPLDVFSKHAQPNTITGNDISTLNQLIKGSNSWTVSGRPVWNDLNKRWEIPAIKNQVAVEVHDAKGNIVNINHENLMGSVKIYNDHVEWATNSPVAKYFDLTFDQNTHKITMTRKNLSPSDPNYKTLSLLKNEYNLVNLITLSGSNSQIGLFYNHGDAIAIR